MPWQLSALVSLHWRCWDDEFVVFDAGSGQTHQLDALTASTLMMLELAASSLDELTTRVADELDIAADEQLLNVVNEAVRGLRIAGLIEFASQ